MENLSFDPKNVRDTLQRTVSIRAFNKGNLGIYPQTDRVGTQIGRYQGDLYSENSVNAQIQRIMREHRLFERYGLSYTQCLAMRADAWDRFVHALEQPYLKRSSSSMEVVATILQRLEVMFSLFIRPKDKPTPPNSNPPQ